MTLTVRRADCVFVTGLILLLVMACPAYPESASLALRSIEPEKEVISDATPDPFFLYRFCESQFFSFEPEGVVTNMPGVKAFAEVIHKEPSTYRSGRPFRCVALLGHDYYGFVFDSTDLYMEGYHQLYFDFNHNGDLTDDGVFQAEPLNEAERILNKPSDKRPWSPEQLIGAPDVKVAGDSELAWSPGTRDGNQEWLILQYEQGVKARGLKVYETYAPGALARVSIIDRTGTEKDLWNGKDPTPATEKMGVSEISFETTDPIDRIKVYIDSKGFPGWNEIDTVGLVDATGETHWPIFADASSFYQRGFLSSAGMTPDRFVPRRFPLLTARIRSRSEEYDYCFSMVTNTGFGEGGVSALNNCMAILSSKVFREGEITLGGVRHKVVLLDYNSNGRFDDCWKVNRSGISNMPLYPDSGDMVVIDPDPKSHEYPGGIHCRAEWQYLSKLLRVDGHYYDISVAPSGATMSLVATKLPLGSIHNPNPFSAVIYGELGPIRVTGTTSEVVEVPAGDWRLLSYRIDRTSPAEVAASQETGTFTERPRTYVEAEGIISGLVTHVTAGANVLLPFGPPYRPIVKMQQGTFSSLGGPARSLSLSLVGSASEVCTSMRIHGSRPPKPSLTIATGKGEIIERGNFEYG